MAQGHRPTRPRTGRARLGDEAAEKHWLRNAGSKPLQVASQIRARLGDPFYHTFLYETFKDRTGADGLTYTGPHAALMRPRPRRR